MSEVLADGISSIGILLQSWLFVGDGVATSN